MNALRFIYCMNEARCVKALVVVESTSPFTYRISSLAEDLSVYIFKTDEL